MSKEKYYIPELEEFCIGFPYEAIPSIGYLSMDLKDSAKSSIIWAKDYESGVIWAKDYESGVFGIKPVDMYGEIPFIISAIKSKKIRVKHLDREDIESLGFTTEKLRYWETDGESTIYRKNNYAIVFWINAHKSNYKTNIYIKQETGLGLHSFKGECKNKSELIKLMKQLKIE